MGAVWWNAVTCKEEYPLQDYYWANSIEESHSTFLDVDWLVQHYSNSSVLAMGLLQFFTNPSMY